MADNHRHPKFRIESPTLLYKYWVVRRDVDGVAMVLIHEDVPRAELLTNDRFLALVGATTNAEKRQAMYKDSLQSER